MNAITIVYYTSKIYIIQKLYEFSNESEILNLSTEIILKTILRKIILINKNIR